MKRQIALEGDRKWYSDHMVELQSEALAAIDKMASYYGPCALSGGEVYGIDTANNQNKFTDAMVVLYVTAEAKWMVMPLPDNGFIGNYSQGRWIVAQKQDVMGEYRLGSDVIAHNYTARFVLSAPGGASGTYIYLPANSARVPDLIQMLANKNATRSLFAQADHSHNTINRFEGPIHNFNNKVYFSYDDGFVVNLAGRNGLDGQDSYGQLRVTNDAIYLRYSFNSYEGIAWSNWLALADIKRNVSFSKSSKISSANYSVSASRRNGYVTINIFATIASESTGSEALITLRDVAPKNEVRIIQPLVSGSGYTQAKYRDLYISPSGNDAIIRMDTNQLVNYSFSINLTYEMA